jgi:hypothetical protein
MTGQLEQSESWNDRKVEMTGNPEYQKSRKDRFDPYASILAECMFIS